MGPFFELLFNSPWLMAIIGGLLGLILYLLPWLRSVIGI